MSKNKDTYSYKGWLVSDKLHKRALAVIGHYIIGWLILFFPILIFSFFVGFFIALS